MTTPFEQWSGSATHDDDLIVQWYLNGLYLKHILSSGEVFVDPQKWEQLTDNDKEKFTKVFQRYQNSLNQLEGTVSPDGAFADYVTIKLENETE